MAFKDNTGRTWESQAEYDSVQSAKATTNWLIGFNMALSGIFARNPCTSATGFCLALGLMFSLFALDSYLYLMGPQIIITSSVIIGLVAALIQKFIFGENPKVAAIVAGPFGTIAAIFFFYVLLFSTPKIFKPIQGVIQVSQLRLFKEPSPKAHSETRPARNFGVEHAKIYGKIEDGWKLISWTSDFSYGWVKENDVAVHTAFGIDEETQDVRIMVQDRESKSYKIGTLGIPRFIDNIFSLTKEKTPTVLRRGRVASNTLTIHTRPSKRSKVVSSRYNPAAKNSFVAIAGEERKGFLPVIRVNFDGFIMGIETGFALAEHIYIEGSGQKPQASAPPKGKTGTVDFGDRSEMEKMAMRFNKLVRLEDANVLKTLHAKDKVVVLGEKDDKGWIKVWFDGYEGYTDARFIRVD